MLLIGLVSLASTRGGRAAEEKFSQAIRAEDYSAAGLAKLSAGELARLDALVREFKGGAREAARPPAAVANEVRAPAEVRAAKEAAVVRGAVPPATGQSGGGASLAKAKVTLLPGAQVDYATIESRMVGLFTGWEGRTVFLLENGQRWQVAGGGVYATPPLPNPAVKIVPGMLGSFWLQVEGVRTRVKVTLLGGGDWPVNR